MQWAIPLANDLAVLQALVEADGLLDAAKAHIATAITNMGDTIALTDITPATFAGSAAKTITWGTPYVGVGGVPQVDTQLLVWIATDSLAPQNVAGIYLTDSAGTTLLGVVKFDSVQPVPGVGNGISLVFGYRRYDLQCTIIP